MTLRLITGLRRRPRKLIDDATTNLARPISSTSSHTELYDYLKGNVYRGTLKYPCHRAPVDLARYDDLKLKHCHFKLVDPGDAIRRRLVRDYMVRTFFRLAPLPQALGLADTLSSSDYLNQEIDNLLDSGLGQVYYHIEGGEMMGAGIHAAWIADPEYEPLPFPFTVTQWLNTAARVAQEATDSPAERAVVWRDLQYQMTYHLGQQLARERGKGWVLYTASSFVDPQWRLGNTADWLFLFYRMAKENNGMFFSLGTIPNFDAYVVKTFADLAHVFDAANYSDLRLELVDGKNAFEGLGGKDGMVYVHSTA